MISGQIIDTLGELYGWLYYNYTCLDSCVIEINCAFTNGTYYLAVGGKGLNPLVFNSNFFK